MLISNACLHKVATHLEGNEARITKAYMIGSFDFPVEHLNATVQPSTIANFRLDIDETINNTTVDDVRIAFREKNVALFELGHLSPCGDHKCVYCISNIYCNDEEDAVVIYGGKNLLCRIWINDCYVYGGVLTQVDKVSSLIKLQKGNNIVIMECRRQDINTNFFKMSFLVRKLSALLSSTNSADELFRDKLAENTINHANVIYDYMNVNHFPIYVASKKSPPQECHILVVPFDFLHLSEKTPILLEVLSSAGAVVCEIQSFLCERIMLDLRDFYGYDATDNFLTVRINYEINSVNTTEQNVIFLGDLNSYALNIINTISDCIHYSKNKEADFLPLAIDDFTDAVSSVLSVDCAIGDEYKLEWLEQDVNQLLAILFDADDMTGYKKVYYTSKLDNNPFFYEMHIPNEYDNTKSYPLLIITSVYGSERNFIEKIALCGQDVLIASIPLRGVTNGSYIGEATFFEVYSLMQQDYCIDADRIYLWGSCAGGYAAYALAQNFPTLFAGLISIFSHPNMELLENLCNISVINVASDEHEEKQYTIPTSVLEKYGNYTGYLFRDSTQGLMQSFGYSPKVINRLLTCRRNNSPAHVEYCADRMRYNKTHYVEIVQLNSFSSFRIEIDIAAKQISIIADNVRVLKLNIPNCYASHSLTINGYEVCTNNIIGDFFVELGNNAATIIDGIEPRYMDRVYGIGLLYGFLGAQQIRVSENPNYMELAELFSSPATFGIRSEITIQYPIHVSKSYSSCATNTVNIGEFLNEPKHMIEFEKDSFSYDGQCYIGEYSILFCEESESNGTNLFVKGNTAEALKKNVFLRKFILPSYLYGKHAYLNNVALVYWNGGYYCIESWGQELKRVLKRT